MAHERGNFPHALRPAFLEQSPDQSPPDAAGKTFLALAAMCDTQESLVADQILRSIETLRLRKDALFVQLEDVLAEAMYELWPDPARRPALRLDAMMAMGTLRFAKENWRQENGARALTFYIDQAFDHLSRQSKRTSSTSP